MLLYYPRLTKGVLQETVGYQIQKRIVHYRVLLYYTRKTIGFYKRLIEIQKRIVR